MLKHSLLLCSACLLSSGALASGHLGAYFVAEADADLSDSGNSLELDGDGFGLFGSFNLSKTDSLYFEYSAVEYDSAEIAGMSGKVDFDFVQVRAGYKSLIPLGQKLSLTPGVEAVSFTLDGETADTGFGLHVALNYQIFDCWSTYAQVGYLSVDEADGPEVKIGTMYQASEKYSLFADYRASRFEDDGADLDVDDVRLGLAIHF